MRSLIATATRGAVAGVIATVPMTGVMLVGRRFSRDRDLPPEEMVERANRKRQSPHERRLGGGRDDKAWRLVHLAVGAASGATYAVLQPLLPRPLGPVSGGVLFGLAEWLVAYQGIAPSVGLMPSRSRGDGDRQATLVVAHVVFGAVVGKLVGDRRRAAGKH